MDFIATGTRGNYNHHQHRLKAGGEEKMETMTETPVDLTRNAVIKRIKTALKNRSGKSWSVTGGSGTAYGWITIDALPAQRTCHNALPAGAVGNPRDYIEVDTGAPGGYMTVADRQELAQLLGLKDPVHCQGKSIMSSHDAYREYIDRAEGRVPAKIAEAYWD